MNISFSMTKDQIRARTKSETRRLGWSKLRVGQVLQGIEKGQGMKKGEHPVHLAWVRVVAVRQEPLDAITPEAVAAEGFPGKSPAWFVDFFCRANGCNAAEPVTVIQFKYVNLPAPSAPAQVEGGQ